MGLIVTSILFGLAGLYVVIYLSNILLKNMYFSLQLKGIVERSSFKRCLQKAGMARHHMANGEKQEAIALFRQSFYLGTPKHQEGLIPRSLEHNLNIIADLIRISDADSEALSKVPTMERLFEDRCEMLKQLLDVQDSLQNAESRSKDQGRRVPSWAINEFKAKLKDIKHQLSDNKLEIQKGLSDIFNALHVKSPNNNVTYH